MTGKRWEKGKTMSGNFNFFNSRKPIKQYQARPQSTSKMLKATETPVEKRL